MAGHNLSAFGDGYTNAEADCEGVEIYLKLPNVSLDNRRFVWLNPTTIVGDEKDRLLREAQINTSLDDYVMVRRKDTGIFQELDDGRYIESYIEELTDGSFIEIMSRTSFAQLQPQNTDQLGNLNLKCKS